MLVARDAVVNVMSQPSDQIRPTAHRRRSSKPKVHSSRLLTGSSSCTVHYAPPLSEVCLALPQSRPLPPKSWSVHKTRCNPIIFRLGRPSDLMNFSRSIRPRCLADQSISAQSRSSTHERAATFKSARSIYFCRARPRAQPLHQHPPTTSALVHSSCSQR